MQEMTRLEGCEVLVYIYIYEDCVEMKRKGIEKTYHSFNGPLRIVRLRVDGHAVINGIPPIRRTSTTDQHSQILRVIRRTLGQKHHGTFERIRSSTSVIVDGPRDLGVYLDGLKGDLVQQPGLVVVGGEDTAFGHDQEWIQVIRVRVGEPLHVELRSYLGEKLEGRHGDIVGASLAAYNEDGPVGHDHGGGIPAAALKLQLVRVLLPVVCAVDTCAAVRSVQTDAIRRHGGPASHVEHAASSIRQDEPSGAEDVGLDVHLSPRAAEVVVQVGIELVGARRVGRAGSPFLEEGHFAIDADGGDERDDDAADEELVDACAVAGRVAPLLQRRALPFVVAEAVSSTADGRWIARAGHVAVRLCDEDTSGWDAASVAAVAFLAVFHSRGAKAILGAASQAGGRIVGGAVDGLIWKRSPADVIRTTANVLPRTRQIRLLRRGDRHDLDGSKPVDAQPVAGTAHLVGVAAAGHVALCVWSLGRVVAKVVVAEALHAVLHAGHLVAQALAGADA